MVGTHSPKGAAHTGSPAVPRRLLLPGREMALGNGADSYRLDREQLLWYTYGTLVIVPTRQRMVCLSNDQNLEWHPKKR